MSVTDALAACQAAAAGPEWLLSSHAGNTLSCREIPQGFSWGSPTTVTITLTSAEGGRTHIALEGSNFGLGPNQANHVRQRVQALRQRIEDAPARPAGPRTFTRSVVVNDVPVSDETLMLVERQYGLRAADGNFWYDAMCGAWGLRGGPVVGFLPPGLPLGGPLPRDASNGNTGVIINGRELHPLDVVALQRLTPIVLPGRYWVDAAGNFGWEGGPAVGNLWMLHHQSHGGASSYTSGGMTVGGDGSGFVYASGKDSLGNYFQVTSG
jgi:hypothetical protein